MGLILLEHHFSLLQWLCCHGQAPLHRTQDNYFISPLRFFSLVLTSTPPSFCTNHQTKTKRQGGFLFLTMCPLSSLDMFGLLVTMWTDHSHWDIIIYSGRQRLEILERAELHELIQVHAVLLREWHHRLATVPEITCIAAISYKLLQGQRILWIQYCDDIKFAGEKNMRFQNLLTVYFFVLKWYI